MKTPGKRFFPIDALRGLIIVFMALDHANYFIAQKHSSGEQWGGRFPAYSSVLPFLTRLVTHFSAPGFFFLMGVGMLLYAESRRKQGRSIWRISTHFWLRGLVLIALQLLVVNFIWKAGPESFPLTYIGVLIALGGTMMTGSLFLQLNSTTLLILTLGLLAGTEWLHPTPQMWNSISHAPWRLIFLYSGGDMQFWSNYPVLPWLELVIFGMLFGRWLLTDKKKAHQKSLWIGIALLVLFVVIRSLNGFGNIRPRAGNSWIDFLNVVKYPPSMAFIFLTMGFNLLVLWGFSRAGTLSRDSGERIQTASKPLVTFGRAPLFVYVLHLGLYMLMGRLFAPQGISIPAMIPYWLAGMVIIYPLALWYGRFKQSQPPDSLWRLF